MLTLCIPTLNRYDLLVQLIRSAEQGTLVPDKYLVIDNGGKLELDFEKVTIVKMPFNVGVAKSWNYFIKNSTETRIISNDDLIFGTSCLETLVNNQDPIKLNICGTISNINAFSLFLINDYTVNKVGLFDEQLSPNYAYFEDNDYAYRCILENLPMNSAAECDVSHVGSATLKKYTKQEIDLHHKKFELAQRNYIAKWGGLPGYEKFNVPFNGGQHAYKS